MTPIPPYTPPVAAAASRVIDEARLSEELVLPDVVGETNIAELSIQVEGDGVRPILLELMLPYLGFTVAAEAGQSRPMFNLRVGEVAPASNLLHFSINPHRLTTNSDDYYGPHYAQTPIDPFEGVLDLSVYVGFDHCSVMSIGGYVDETGWTNPAILRASWL